MGPNQENPLQSPPQPHAVQIPRHLLLAAARRIVSQNSDSEVAARRLIANATENQIDLSLLFGVVGPGESTRRSVDQEIIRQVCLIVKGAGRTSITFLSEPPRNGEIGTPSEATADRAACLLAACTHLKSKYGDAVQVAQALPDPRDIWAIESFVLAGFTRVGDLQYLRRPWRSALGVGLSEIEPEVHVLPLSSVPQSEHNAVLLAALDSSYVDTLDCPELCGLRTTQDILDSHLATGSFVPELWWVVLQSGRPLGCVLFSPIPAQRAVELVYLGLAPELRGKGLSSRLLSMGIAQVKAHPMLQFGFEELTCAVDTRNIPARKIYERAGFSAFAERIAFVKTL